MASRIPRIACPDPRATQEPEGGGWEPSARIRAFRSQLRARTRSTESPPGFPARRGPEPSSRSEMDQLGPKTGRVQPQRPPLWNFATAFMAGGPHAAREYWIAGAVR